MPISSFNEHITSTLLYYDIFDHPLTIRELFYLFPQNSMMKTEFISSLKAAEASGKISIASGYVKLSENSKDVGLLRRERERIAKRRLRIAKFMTKIIKRFPFVRGVFLSGDLSKGVAHPQSDIDYVVVTEPHRLWICRTLLVVFKKTFLLNSKKYFCLNYYVAADRLQLEDRNYFTATEIAHLKPLYHLTTFVSYMNANAWIKQYFPNYRVFALAGNEVDSHRSLLQRVAESLFRGQWLDRLDLRLMRFMARVWARRYPGYDAETHARIFRCTPSESCTYVGNFSDKILWLYAEKLREHYLR